MARPAPGQRASPERGVGGDRLVAVFLDRVEQAQLGPGMRALAPDWEPGACGEVGGVPVEQSDNLGDLGPIAYLSVCLQYRVSGTWRQCPDRLVHLLVDRGADREMCVHAGFV